MSARPTRGLELLDAGEQLSPRSVRELLTASAELEAIVRDLAAADGEAGVDIVSLWTRAKAWVAAHPVSGTETTDG